MPLCLRILGQSVRIDCADPDLRSIFATNFAAMVEKQDGVAPGHRCNDSSLGLHYHITRSKQNPGFVLSHAGKAEQSAKDAGDLLFQLEKDIIVELQRRCPDYLFLHAATLDWRGKACLLVGESGAGKSTTAWALQHHEFGYLSDELSLVDLDALRVHAYPHALCLKKIPSSPYSLPEGALDLGATIHVPTAAMPGPVILDSRPLSVLFLLKYSPENHTPTLRAMGAAEASIHLYVSTLNALAHSNSGLDAVVRLAELLPCFAVARADLASTCALIKEEMEKASHLPGSKETAVHRLQRARVSKPT